MATPRVTIDELPEQTVPLDSDLVIVHDAGVTKKITVDNLKTVSQGQVDLHIADPSGAHAASAISAAPHTGVDATDVQGQLEQISEALAVKDVVWVGAEAPVDPVIEMWWDSDAESAYLPSPPPPVDFASDVETIAGTATDLAVHPAGLAAAGDIDPRKYGLVAYPNPGYDNGVANSAAIQAAINEACGAGDPVSTARYANRRVILPAGRYLLDTTITIRSVIGLHIEGRGLCELRANANMTSVFDINGMAISRIGGFTITGTTGVQVDNAIYTYWDNAAASFVNTGNSYHDIVIRNLDYVAAIRVGKLSASVQVDNDEYRNLFIEGTWDTGNTTRWQYGLYLGGGVAANNLVHHVYKYHCGNVRYPIYNANTEVAVYGAGIAGCDTAIWCQPHGYALFSGFDVESAERLYYSPGAGGNINVTLSDITFRANEIIANGRFIDSNMGGSIHIRNVNVKTSAVQPVVNVAGSAHVRGEVDGLSVATTTATLWRPEDGFIASAVASIGVRGYIQVNSAGAAVGSMNYTVPHYNNQTGTTYTLAQRDHLIPVVRLDNAAAITLTIPTNATVPIPIGARIQLLQIGAGQVTVAPAGGVTVAGTPGLKLRAQYSQATLLKTFTDQWYLSGDLAA